MRAILPKPGLRASALPSSVGIGQPGAMSCVGPRNKPRRPGSSSSRPNQTKRKPQREHGGQDKRQSRECTRKHRPDDRSGQSPLGEKCAPPRAEPARFCRPALSQEVEALAREMAGANASSEIQELARRIAEAQIDLRRVRCARHDLLSRALCDPDYDSSAAKRKKSKLAVAAAKLRAKVELNPLPTPLISQLLI